MNFHHKTVCKGCHEVVVECRTLAQCADRCTEKDTHAVDHDRHLAILEIMAEAKSERSVA